MARPPRLPSSLPGGELMPFVSKAYLRQQMETVDAAIGGTDRMIAEAGKNSESYWTFQALRAKLMPKESVVEHEIKGIDSLLDRADEYDKAHTIEGEFKAIS